MTAVTPAKDPAMLGPPAAGTPFRGRISRASALTVVLTYAVFAALWILLSDKAVEWLFADPAELALASTLKGWFFVAVTSLLLFGLLRRLTAEGEATAPVVSRAALARQMLLAAALIVPLTGVGVFHAFNEAYEVAAARLHAVGELKATQIADWLAERQADTEFVRSSTHYADLYREWRQRGDADSAARLRSRLGRFIDSRRYGGLVLLDPQGQPVWSSDPAMGNVEADLADAVEVARDTGGIQRVGPYRDHAGVVHLDFVAPLGSGPATPFVVLHADPASWLYPAIRAWPVPSASSENLLLRRQGDDIVYLSELRHRHDAALTLHDGASDEGSLVRLVFERQTPAGGILHGTDYRGATVLASVQPVAHSDWLLVSKVDRAEVLGQAVGQAVWITLAGLLALFIAGVGVALMRQRQQLAVNRAVHDAQAQRLAALKLLDTIVDSSEDAVFAKDLDGRYLLFNRAAGRFVGRDPHDILGLDDRSIFPPAQADALIAINRRIVEQRSAETIEESLDTPDGPRTFLAVKGPLIDEEGRVTGTFGISRDITQRKRAEQALRESGERLHLFIEHAPAALAMFDREMRYLAASRRWMSDYGLGSDEIAGRSHYEVFPEIPERWRLVHRRVLAGEVIRSASDTFERRDGRVHSVRWEARPWRTGDGGIGGIVIFSEDITEQLQAERDLRKYTEELKRRNDELERFNRASVGRELDMIELKQLVNRLSHELGREPPYDLDFIDTKLPPTGSR